MRACSKHSEETKEKMRQSAQGKDILWLWEHEINDEWFDIADYLEI